MSNYRSVLSPEISLDEFQSSPMVSPFSEESIYFLDTISKSLLSHENVRQFPELVSLAFWLRRASVEHIKQEFLARKKESILMPRGVVFHIAPSNVDTIFIYSWVLSMLAGNKNIVKISNKTSIQVEFILSVLKNIFQKEFSSILKNLMIVRYLNDDSTTRYFSSFCDVRVIWGGDETVNHIRSIPLLPTSFDVSFSGKYSFTIVNSYKYLQMSENEQLRIADGFFNDSYWFNQQACSSPRLVLWVGDFESCKKAARKFWPLIEKKIDEKKVKLSLHEYMNKFIAQHMLSTVTACTVMESSNGLLNRIWLENPDLYTEYHCGSGLFLESSIQSLGELNTLLTRRVQTVTYAGFRKEELKLFITSGYLNGIDRIVPCGKALEFSPIWDGFDLLRTFTREITIY